MNSEGGSYDSGGSSGSFILTFGGKMLTRLERYM